MLYYKAEVYTDMKRRHYRIHYIDRAQPMKRVKHREVPWRPILLILLALLIVSIGVVAVLKWTGVNGGV